MKIVTPDWERGARRFVQFFGNFNILLYGISEWRLFQCIFNAIFKSQHITASYLAGFYGKYKHRKLDERMRQEF